MQELAVGIIIPFLTILKLVYVITLVRWLIRPQWTSLPGKTVHLLSLKSHSSSCRRIKNSPSLKVISINLNGIRSKVRTFHEMISSENPTLFSQETGFDPTVASPEIYPSGYTVYRKDR